MWIRLTWRCGRIRGAARCTCYRRRRARFWRAATCRRRRCLSALLAELTDEGVPGKTERGTVYGLQSVYTRMMGVSGPILVDSYHVGQTFFNDYGRPHETGFNNITGFSTLNEQGPWSLYVRGEYQHAPSAAGYTQALAQQVSLMDEIVFAPPNDPQATVPAGPIAAANPFRLVEATLSVHILGHEISGGKSDAWLGPGMGSAMPWSNNAENIYSFRINRVEPINIKYLSRWLGPVRYDFFYGSLKGHTDPNDDWAHSDMFSFQPTANFQFGFQRTVIFGGKGHEPVTIRTFLKGFFDTNDTNGGEKGSRDDPGARFSAFDFSYRLPFVRNYLTLYADSEVHDDLTPVSAPRRAAYRPGIYLSQFPGLKRLEPAGGGGFDRLLDAGVPGRRQRIHRGRGAEAGLHQQGKHPGRLDRARGQGRTGVADVAPEWQRVGAGGVPEQEGGEGLHRGRDDAEPVPGGCGETDWAAG